MTHSATTAHSAERIARWMANVNYDDLPAEVIARVKTLLLDLVGVGIAGSDTEAAQAAQRFTSSQFPGDRGSVWATSIRSSVLGTAFCNATAANALDLEDGSRATVGHPGSLVIPAAIAAAEDREATGRQLIEAIAIGYETAIAIGGSRKPYPGDRWAHGWEAFGPAAAVARIAGLSADRSAQALALAGFQGPNQPAGLATRAATLIKSPAPGWSTVSGAAGAAMAEAGLTAPIELFDDPRHYDPGLAAGLGSWRLLDVYLKPHASCRWTHAAIDAVLAIRGRYGVDPSSVESIAVDTFREALLLDRRRPRNPIQAQFSLPYAVAAAMVDGSMGPGQQLADRLDDPLIAAVEDVLELNIDAAHDAAFPRETGATVTVRTGASEYCQTIRNPIGDPAQPMSGNDVVEKFHRLAGARLGRRRSDEIEDAVSRLEIVSAREFTRLLTP